MKEKVEQLAGEIAEHLKGEPLDVCARAVTSVLLGLIVEAKGTEAADAALKTIESIFKE